MKKIRMLCLLLLSIVVFYIPTNAQVTSTAEPTSEKGIYIAGNPELYPLEYYNEKTENYEGILPELYEEISDSAGVDFTYIAANSTSRQKELGENCQVEVVSAYLKGEIQVAEEVELFTYMEDGKEITVCIGFTDIIDSQLKEKIREKVLATDKEMWMAAAMTIEQSRSEQSVGFYVIALATLIILCVVLICVLVSGHRKGERQNKIKMNDELTGIGNLLYFEDCFQHHINSDNRVLYHVAYIALDIEKAENYYSTEETQELQTFAAMTISNDIGDLDFVARIRNGVFVVCLMAPELGRAVAKINELLTKLNGHKMCVAQGNNIVFRCGLFSLGQHAIPCETVLFNARQGYLIAAQEEKLLCVSDESVLKSVGLKGRLQKKLISAIEKDEFHVYLQFIYDVRLGRLCGAEVLSRWHNPQEGVQGPGVYIQELKAAGMIEKLDFHILEKTCQQLHIWSSGKYRDLYLSCNFTRLTLSDEKFLVKFEEILERYPFDREKLMIEITEDSLAKDREVAFNNISGIKKTGCRVALDDMGSGYTSFSDLCDYPIDVIKIDGHMLKKATGERGYAVLHGITQMAHDLCLKVLCEGVENQEEQKIAQQIDCDYIQGFLYSRVLPVEVAMEFYEKGTKDEIDSK